MSQFLGFGNGGYGFLSGSASPCTQDACSGTDGANTLTTNLALAVGDMIIIHQTQHASDYGKWEVNIVTTATAGGSCGVLVPLTYAYTTGAQVVKMAQTSGIQLSGASIVTPSATWNGTRGGDLALTSTGIVVLNCNDLAGLSAGQNDGAYGFRGADGIPNNGGGDGRRGEGRTSGEYNSQGASSGSYGGGGAGTSGSGGGGGAAASGNGTNATGGGAGSGGIAFLSDATLASIMTFGAGGGSGAANAQSHSGTGGVGGGCLWLFAPEVVILGSNRNIMANAGSAGGSGQGSGSGAGGNGGGGAGCIFIKTRKLTQTTNGQIVATGSAGSNGVGGGSGQRGGDGSNGVIRLETCFPITTTTTPAFSPATQAGGYVYCFLGGTIFSE